MSLRIASAGRTALWVVIASCVALTAYGQNSVVLRHAPSGGAQWAFSADASLLAVGTRKVVHVWQVSQIQAGDLQPSVSIESGGQPVGFAMEGRLLLSQRGNEVDLCDLKQGRVVKTLSLEGASMVVAISPDGSRLATGTALGGGATVSVWNTQTGRRIRTFKEKSERMIVSLAFSPDGELLAAGGYMEVVRLWEVRSGTLRWEQPAKAILEEVSFSPDSKTLVAVGGDVFIWPDLSQGEHPQVISERNVSFNRVAFLPQKGLVALSEDREVRIWDPGSEAFVGKVGHQGASRRTLSALAVSTDESTVLTVFRNEVSFWPTPPLEPSKD